MKLNNKTKVIVKPYQKENAAKIKNQIVRNFREVNIKNYDKWAKQRS